MPWKQTSRPRTSPVEADGEARFNELKNQLREDVQNDSYPSEEAIDRFAKLIASESEQNK